MKLRSVCSVHVYRQWMQLICGGRSADTRVGGLVVTLHYTFKRRGY
jgi:hypothetical protein